MEKLSLRNPTREELNAARARDEETVATVAPLPKAVQLMQKKDLACKFCGVSYLICSEVRTLERELKGTKNEVEVLKKKLSQIKQETESVDSKSGLSKEGLNSCPNQEHLENISSVESHPEEQLKVELDNDRFMKRVAPLLVQEQLKYENLLKKGAEEMDRNLQAEKRDFKKALSAQQKEHGKEIDGMKKYLADLSQFVKKTKAKRSEIFELAVKFQDFKDVSGQCLKEIKDFAESCIQKVQAHSLYLIQKQKEALETEIKNERSQKLLAEHNYSEACTLSKKFQERISILETLQNNQEETLNEMRRSANDSAENLKSEMLRSKTLEEENKRILEHATKMKQSFSSQASVVEGLKGNVATLEADKELLKKDLENSNDVINGLKDSVRVLESTISKEREISTAHSAKYSSWQEKYAQLHRDSENRITEAQNEIQSKLNKVVDEREYWQQAFNCKEVVVTEQKEKLKRLESELETTSNTSNSLQLLLKQDRLEREHTQQELNALRVSSAHIENELNISRNTIAQLEKSRIESNQKWQDEILAIQRTQVEASTRHEKEVEKLLSANDTMRKEIAALQITQVELRSLSKSLESKIQDLERDLEQSRLSYSKLDHERLVSIQTMKDRAAQLHRAMVEKEEQLNAALAEVSMMQSNNSHSPNIEEEGIEILEKHLIKLSELVRQKDKEIKVLQATVHRQCQERIQLLKNNQ